MMMYIWARISIFLFIGEVIARRTENSPPEIVDHPDDTTVPKGSPVTLNCRADGYPIPELRWYKDGVLLDMDDHYSEYTTGNLFIVSVESKRSQSDDGVYQCEARNSFGVARSKNATLVVAYLKEDFRLEPSNTDSVVGGPLVLECQPPKGNPSPVITWEKGQRPIEPDGERVRVLRDGNLMISPAVIGDTGSYRCIATIDVIGSKTSSSARVEIHERPTIVTGPDDIKALPGETVNLECIAEGKPPPSISWLKDGGALPEGRFTAGSNSLVIRDAIEDDSGVYVCVAENRWGSVRAGAEVEVDASPRFTVRPVDQTIREGQDIEVPCQAEGSPPPALMWMTEDSEDYLFPRHSEGKLSISADSSLIIRDADTTNEGVYICSTFSELGMMESPMTLRVVPDEYTLPPIIQYGPADQIMAVGGTARLTCGVEVSLGTEDSEVTITWLKEDSRVDERDQHLTQSDDGTLEVSSLESQDGGIYTCVVGNDVGETSWSARLQVIRETDSSTFLSQPPPDPSDLPGAPGMPFLVNQTAGRGVILGWKRPYLAEPEVLGYIIEGVNTEEKSKSWQNFGDTETNRIDLRNLPTETEMMFIVRARNAEGVGPPSPVSHPIIALESRMGVEAISSDLEPGLTEPPLELPWVYITGVTPLSSTTIQVMWRVDPTDVVIDGFRIQYKETSTSSQWTTEPAVTDANMVILNNLQGNTEYDIRVYAFSGRHEGDQSNEVKVRTFDTDDLIIPRESVLQTKLTECGITIRRVEVLGPTEVKISWQLERNVDYIDGFYVKLQSLGNPDDSRETIENKQVKVMRDLRPWTTYSVSVQPYSGVFKGPETDRVVVRTAETAPQAPPKVIDLQSLNTTAFHVRWKAPPRDRVPGIILGYHIFCRSTPTNHQSNITVTGNTTFDGIIGNLTPGQSYGVRVAAYTVAGIGPFSATKLQTLPPAVNGPTNRGDSNPANEGGGSDDSDSLGFLAHPVVFAVVGVVLLLLLTSCLLLIWRRRRKKHTHSVSGDEDEATKENSHKLGHVSMTKGHAVACCSAGDGSSSASCGSLEKPPPPPNHPQGDQVPSHWLQEAYDPPQFKQPNKVFLRHDSTSGVSSGNYPTLSTFHGNHMSANSPEYAVVENPDGTSSPSPVPGIVYGPPVHPPNFLPVGSMAGHLYPHHLMEDPEPYASSTLMPLPGTMRKPPPCSGGDSSSDWTNSWNSQPDHRKAGPQQTHMPHFEQPRKGSRDGGPPVPRRDHSVSGFSDQSSLYSSASSQGGTHRMPRHHMRKNNPSPANWSELMPPPPGQGPPTDHNVPPPLPGQGRPRQEGPQCQIVNSHHGGPHALCHQTYPVNSMNIHDIQQPMNMNNHELNLHNQHQLPMVMGIHENYPVGYPDHFDHPQGGQMDMHRTPHPIHGYSYDGAFQPTGPNTHSLERTGQQYCERCPDCVNAKLMHHHGGSFHGDNRHNQSPRTVQALNAQNSGPHDTRTYPGPAHGEHFQMNPTSYQNSSPRPRKKDPSAVGQDPPYAQMQPGGGADPYSEGGSTGSSSIASQRVFVDPRHAQIGQELLKYMSQEELRALAGKETGYAPMKPAHTASTNGKVRAAVSDSEMDDGARETDFDLISNGRLSASCASLTSCNTSQCNSNCSGSVGSLIEDVEFNDVLSNLQNNFEFNGSSQNDNLPTEQPNASSMVSRFDGTKVKPALLHPNTDSRQRMLATTAGKKEDVV